MATGQKPADLLKDELARLLKRRASATSNTYDASANQIRSWLYRQQAGVETVTLWWSARLITPLSTDRLRAAFQALVLRHSALRSVFRMGENGLAQVINGYIEFVVEEMQLEPGACIKAAVARCYARPFDIEREPLLRVCVIRVAAGEDVLVVAADHLVCDLWSFMIVLKEAGAVLAEGEGRASPMPPAAQYTRFSAWQRAFLDTSESADAWSYWSRHLGPDRPVTQIVPDRTRPAIKTIEPDMVAFALDERVMSRLHTMAQREAVSPFVLLFAAFNVALYRYTGEADLLVGTVATGRSRTEFHGTVGDFINAVPVRQRLSPDVTFRDALQQLRNIVRESFSHQDLPFSELAQRFGGARDAAVPPLFRIMFLYQKPHVASELLVLPAAGGARAPVEWGGGWIEPLELSQYGQEDDANDLTCELIELDGRIFGRFRFDPQLFDRERMAGFVACLETLLADIADGEDRKIAALRILPPADHERIVGTFNDTEMPLPLEEVIHRAFEAQARRTPDATAVRFGGETLSYAALDARADRTAALLRAHGTERDDLIGLYMDRSIEMVEAIYAVWKSGGAYVPLSPTDPPAYTSTLLDDATPRIVLTQRRFRSALLDIAPEAIVICLDDDQPPIKYKFSPQGRVDGASLAYVIYTSGSTGRPKGVLCTHAGLINRIGWMQAQYRLQPDDVVLQKTPFTFDVSVWEFAWPLVQGATLVVAQPESHRDPEILLDLIAREKVTVAHFVPSMLDLLLETDRLERCASLTRLFCSGEALGTATAARAMRSLPAELHNLYGPTEASIDVTFWRCSADDADRATVPIGRPIGNMRVYIVDAAGTLCPIGVAGEICLVGIGLARGYLNRPELTAERFVPCPWQPDERMYRTGDLGRWRGDGAIEFMGRIDQQLKLRGFRIEPEAIEAVLIQHSAISAATVLVTAGPAGDPRLCAYCVTREAVSDADLRAHVAARLPDYMVPALFVRLAALPLTSSGKLDRRALPSPDRDAAGPAASPAPIGELEETLARLFSQVLGVERIGRDDSFFALGGHSLQAVRLAALVRRDFGRHLSLRALFAEPTVRGLGRMLAGAAAADFVVIPRAAERAAYPLSAGQRRLYMQQQLDPAGVAYNIASVYDVRGPLDPDRLEAAFRGVIARYEALRTGFELRDGELVQIVHAEPAWMLERASGSDAADPIRWRAFVRPFDLAAAPLLRARLTRLAEDRHALWLDVHHIAADGISLGLLLDEVAARYRGDTLPAVDLQPKDVAVWQQGSEYRDAIAAQKRFWLDLFADPPAPLDLPTDFARPARRSFAGARHRFTLEAHLVRRLDEMCRRRGLTLYMGLLAALSLVLSRSSGRTDVVVGAVTAGRNHAQLEPLVGMLVNTLALRTRADADKPLGVYLDELRAMTLGAFENQDYPFEELVEALGGPRDPGRNPLFDVQLVLNDMAAPRPDRNDLTICAVDGETAIAKFDLSWIVRPVGDALACELEYSTALFAPASMARLAERLTVAVARLGEADPGLRLGDLDVLSAAERTLLVDGFNPRRTEAPADRLLPQRIADTAAVCLTRIAVEGPGGDRLDYAALEHRAVALAGRMAGEHQIGRGSVVALLFDHGPGLIVAVLAVAKSGAAYLPLEPAWPAERIDAILRDSAAALILTEPSLAPRFAQAATPVFVLDASAEPDAAPASVLALLGPCADDPAYILYTSGSTGRSKGVVVTHGALANYLAWAEELYQLGPEPISMGLFTSTSFDLTVTSLFLPLVTGGRVVAISATNPISALEQVLAHAEINTVKLTPSHLELARALPGGAGVQTWIVGGENLRAELAATTLLRSVAGSRLFNEYGPTEITVACTAHQYRPEDTGTSVSIGVPGRAMAVFVAAADGRLAPIGAEGELCVAGAGLAAGYLGRPDLTEAAFVPCPWLPGQRMYRTGDLARWRSDGRLDYRGRIDQLIKVRGVRIEPGEVEAVLLRHPDVREAVVLALNVADGRQLVAYHSGDRPVSAASLRSHLAATLPSNMVPAAYVQLERLPISANGKLDRAALPRPGAEAYATQAFAPPVGATEEALAAVWSQALRRDRIGRHDNFFEIGGDSLACMGIVARTPASLARPLTFQDIFQNPTIAELAAALDAGGADRPAPGRSLVPLPEARYDPFPLTDVQHAYWIGRSALFALGGIATHSYLELDVPELDLDRFARAWRAVVRRHEMLRAVFTPQGMQVTLPDTPDYVVPIADLAAVGAAEEARVLAALRERMSHQLFDLAAWPLFEIRASLLGNGATRLHLSFDALVGDAASFRIISADLLALYRDESATLPSIGMSFRDYVIHHEAEQASAAIHADLAFWHERIPRMPGAPQLPLVAMPEQISRPRFVRRRLDLDANRWTALKARAQALRSTPSALLLAAFAEVLARWSAEARFVLNLTLFNRPPVHPDIGLVVGDFTSLSLIEIDFDAPTSFADDVRAVQATLWEALAHRAVSGVRVLRDLAQQRGSDWSGAPVVFTSTLGLDEGGTGPAGLADLGVEAYGITQTPQVWLDQVVSEVGGRLVVVWDALEALFPDGMLDAMFEAHGALLAELADDPDRSDRPAFAAPPPPQLTAERASRDLPFGRGELLHLLFDTAADVRPDATAIVAGDTCLSYADLRVRALSLAARLAAAGARRGDRIVVLARKGWPQAVATLATLWSGCAYVPIDPEYPPARVAELVADAGARLILMTQDQRRAWAGVGDAAAITIDLPPDASPAAPAIGPAPDDLAYIIYTSGTTGSPKGVMITHRAAANTIHDINARFGVTHHDRVLAVSALNFDLSVWDIFGTLAAGGTIVYPDAAREKSPSHWADLVSAHGVSVWNSVPALTQLLADELQYRGALASGLRLVMMSGDWIALTLPERMREVAPWATMMSLGGATEASIWSVFHEIGAPDPSWPSIPYGRPLSRQGLRILDHRMRDCPDWTPGDLYISGDGLARGYWGDDARTRQAFVRHPVDGMPLYRTGDRARFRPGGIIEFLGREDTQVKINGMRVELGEVEAVIDRHPAVRRSVVVAHGPAGAGKRLAAFVVPENDGTRSLSPLGSDDASRHSHPMGTTDIVPTQHREPLSDGAAGRDLVAELEDYARRSLPLHLRPAAFTFIRDVPLSANGKVKVADLPEPDWTAADETPYEAPSGETETVLAEIWAELLDVAAPGVHDEFFAAGGNSLIAVKLATRIQHRLGVAIGLGEMFEARTIRKLRHMIEEARLRQLQEDPEIDAVLAELEGMTEEQAIAFLAAAGG